MLLTAIVVQVNNVAMLGRPGFGGMNRGGGLWNGVPWAF
jgi:hypothetical protein